MDKRLLVLTDLEKANPRIPRIVKYLPSRGWKVTLVIPRPSRSIEDLFIMDREELRRSGVDIIEVGTDEEAKGRRPSGGIARKAKDISIGILARPGMGRVDRMVRKQYWRARIYLNYPEPDVGWTKDAYPVLQDLLRKGEHSVLLTSSSPVTVNIIASRLKEEHGIPWVAEFRDLWSLNHNSPFGPVMRMVDRRLERRTVRNADAIVTVTEDWARKQRELHGKERVLHIPIAYDRSETPQDVPLTSDFTLTYPGLYYEDKQDPFLVLDAIRELMDEGVMDRARTEVRFYGTNDVAIRRYVNERGMGDAVTFHPRVRREESLRRQMESQVLLYFNWEDERQKGVCSLKLIEYLFSGRPILLTGGVKDNLMASIVESTGAGAYAAGKDELKRTLAGMYREYMETGSVRCGTDPKAIERYDVSYSVRSYAELFDELTREG